MENKVISVERIKQYTCIPSEAPLVIEDSCPSKEWPMFGNVELLDLKVNFLAVAWKVTLTWGADCHLCAAKPWVLQVRYSSTSPLVLRGINCVFEGGQKIGIVGRTGSGKSTLIQTLFRLVEPDDGKIVIDGVDIASIGLHDLRCKLSIIPQDPTLFEGVCVLIISCTSIKIVVAAKSQHEQQCHTTVWIRIYAATLIRLENTQMQSFGR